jgi:hypothetical protein
VFLRAGWCWRRWRGAGPSEGCRGRRWRSTTRSGPPREACSSPREPSSRRRGRGNLVTSHLSLPLPLLYARWSAHGRCSLLRVVY